MRIYAELLSSLDAAKEIRLFRLGPFFQNRMLGELRVIQRAAQQTDRRELVIYALSGSLGPPPLAGSLTLYTELGCPEAGQIRSQLTEAGDN